MSAAALLEPPDSGAVAFAEGIGATPSQMADLVRFREMLIDWNGRMSLVSAASLDDFWTRHALDSAQLPRLAPEALRWVDIGAGAGFPGLVVAILLKGRAGGHVDLVESQAKKCRFLDAVVETLALPAAVRNARAEELAIAADVVTARAVAPLDKLLEFACPHLAKGGIGLFPKGQGAESEIEAARRRWRFGYE